MNEFYVWVCLRQRVGRGYKDTNLTGVDVPGGSKTKNPSGARAVGRGTGDI